LLLFELFLTFLMIGFISFGGGYAMIPVIEREVADHGWMTTQELTDAIAISGMSPGPIATNSAVYVGYFTAGLPGALIATFGMVLPSFILVSIAAAFYYRLHDHPLVKSAFYGLRPIITALILYGAYRFGESNGMLGPFDWGVLFPFTVFLLALVALVTFKVHPVVTIIASGMIGIVFYG
jgi:chromate transporter